MVEHLFMNMELMGYFIIGWHLPGYAAHKFCCIFQAECVAHGRILIVWKLTVPDWVGENDLPSHRTVRAVLPHTALQKVVSSSGLARTTVGFIQGEKPKVSEVGIRPLAVVRVATPKSRAFILLT